MEEVFRPVLGYEGLYEVSDCGGIRALDRQVKVAYGATRTARGRVAILGKHAQGYLTANLSRGNKARAFLVHRLVVEAFLRRIEPKEEVNHKDGDKTNNRVGNLEIVTRQGNIDHAVSTGLIDNKGENNAAAKLTEAIVLAIRADHAAGMGYKRLSRKHGVTWGTARNVATRRTWPHLS